MKMRIPLPARIAGLLVLLALGLPGEGRAQAAGEILRLALPSGETLTVTAERHRGYPALPAGALEPMGWRGVDEGETFVLTHRTGLALRFQPGSPFLWWEDEPVQLAHPPYRLGERVYLPVQLLVDVFPGFLPHAYTWRGEDRVLEVEGAEAQLGAVPDPPGAHRERRGSRLVVIDPGHGGHDTGAVGPGGLMEKDVALAVSLALARELESDSTLDVRLTRDADEFIPLWERGAIATEWKGDRPGVFLSIHANALPDRPDVRGFETYFLAEARTEHERRVAAAENASMHLDRSGDTVSDGWDDPLLAEILRDLRTFDHQHWSALLAELVQDELGRFHPGPDRGVKQGPFAVITNSLMPSVLVEVGFVTHRDEEGLLRDPAFHRDTARAIAASVHRFLERYPPGSTSR
jgi:N-acetylmuramoyl-L-alanine amidase